MLGVATPLLVAACLSRDVAGITPNTTNVVVDQIEASAVDKIDLLFMIDNSISMGDKQEILGQAVPVLARRLVQPTCVGELDPTLTRPRETSGACPAGFKEEFRPIRDIHIGVVTSSLGGYGGVFCDEISSGFEAPQNDGALLVASVRTGVPSHEGSGFLFWGPDLGGESDITNLEAQFTQHVQSTGEAGCGYEASLEAWYRFLIHPAPPAEVIREGGRSSPAGVDEALLAQRRAFLRPDSLVAVIMLTDENDCSVNLDAGLGWLVTSDAHLPRSTAACADDPNGTCCRSCATTEAAPPTGCEPIATDPSCSQGAYPQELDDWNLRCWDQKRRFGLDLLYPVARYVTGLRDASLCPASPFHDLDCSCDAENERRRAAGQETLTAAQCAAAVGEPVQNPLFTDLEGRGRPVRTPDLVFLTGIVGVPWQDIATDESLTGPGLSYRTAAQLAGTDLERPDLTERWSLILGDPVAGIPPADPFMVESSAPRPAGINPITQDAITPPGGAPNGVNGTEYENAGGDLQYACIFPRATPRVCQDRQPGCSCASNPENPLCNGATQERAKGYPGLRELHVLRDLGDNAIVASICPKVSTGDTSNPAYGYTPAVDAIVTRLKDVLKAKCLPRPLSVDAEGNVQCKLVESTAASSCECSGLRVPAGAAVDAAVRRRLRDLERCGGPGQVACDALCLCEYSQPTAAQRASCQTATSETLDQATWCYIDAEVLSAVPGANASILEGCRPTERQVLRFISSPSEPIPAKGATLTIACLGSAL